MQKKILSVAIAALLPAVNYAQDNSDTLDTVIVNSVYAVPAERDNTGSSVTILTEKDFQERNATYVVDALKTVPSIATGANGGRGTVTSVFMRGANSNHVLVVIDGIKMNPANGNAFNFGGLTLDNIERIEVLRGEQSALWGSQAIGGVINITTKSGKYADKPFNADIHIGGGSNKTLDTSATFYGKQDGLYYAINANHNRTDGISSTASHEQRYTTETGRQIVTGGAVEDDAFDKTSGSIKLGYEFESAGVEAFYQHSKSTVQFDGGTSARNLGNPFAVTELGMQSINTEDLLKLSGYLGNHDDLIRQNAYITYVKSNSDVQDPRPFFSRNIDENRLGLGYQIDYNFDRDGATTQAVSALLEYQKNKYRKQDFAEAKALKEKSIALEYRLFNENDHALALGLRYDDNSQFSNAFTYKLSGGYRINDNFRLHGSLGTGIKNPTIIEMYGWDGSWQGNPDLKPEKSRGGEFGVLIEDNSGNHSLDLTYFNRQFTDSITRAGNQSVNAVGKTRAYGVEANYKGQINEKVSVFANYTYSKTKGTDGRELLRRPAHQANLGVNYAINDQFSTHANINYIGKRKDDYYPAWPNPAERVTLPSYTIMNLGANYKINKNLETYLNVNNVFDEKYETALGYGQPGRNFYLGLKGSW